MEQTKIKNNNEKLNRILYFLPFLAVFFTKFEIDKDTYWIIKTGEYIVNHGFPETDPLTMHSSMQLIVQQWIADVLYYKAYSLLGALGPMLIVVAMYITVIALMQKFASLMTSNPLTQFVFITIAALYLKAFEVTRPQIFTYCMILTELLCLEYYVRKKNIKYLIPLPILSLFAVNIHASMITMQFIVLLPYIAEAILSKFKIKGLTKINPFPLIIVPFIMLAAGFINPYGFRGLSFLFTASVGNVLNSFIQELQPVSLSGYYGIVYFISLVIIICCYMFNRKGKTQLRYIFLTAGMGFMMMAYIKLAPYFIICAFPTVLAYLDNVEWPDLTKVNNKSNGKERKSLTPVLLVIVCILFAGVFGYYCVEDAKFVKSNGESKWTITMDTAIETMQKDIEENNVDNVVLYNGFDEGGYLEFKGYKAYIDARADSFLKENNKEFDYLKEYLKVHEGKTYYKDFVDKYDFNYFFMKKSDPLLVQLEHDDKYSTIFKNDDYVVVKKL